MLTLIVKGNPEQAVAAVAARLGGDLPVEAVKSLDYASTKVVLADAPLGHDVHRWLAEAPFTPWVEGFGAPVGTLLFFQYA